MFIRAKRGVAASIVAITCMVTACEGEVVSPLTSPQPIDGEGAAKPGFHLTPVPGVINVKPGDKGSVQASESGRYIVHFKEETVAARFGALQKAGQATDARLKMANPDISAYKQELAELQKQHVADMSSVLGRNAVTRTFTTALNAAVVVGAHSEAIRLSKLAAVKLVEPDHFNKVDTDRGPTFIGAPAIWEGTAGAGVASKGENMIVGIIDTGIAFNVAGPATPGAHASFLAKTEDGYEHKNPKGAGKFLGGCVEHPEWCNDKLIGVYSFLDAQGGVDVGAPDMDPIWNFKDLDGHGSHVASTVAGNPLTNIPLADADGKPSKGFSFERISGVAPRANIISYKVCAPSCATSDVVAAVEQAIEDGVDVINHSIGSEPGSPWEAAKSLAFLSAREAGVFVSSSAGNDGPTAAVAARVGNAPWNAGVAATTHDRAFQAKGLTLTGGDTAAPTGITGFGLTGAFTGRIVYAKNFPFGAAGQPGFDSPQTCQLPFPAGTFQADQIVICDRGVNGRAAKGQNVRDGGAGGFILTNVTGGGASVDADAHVIPAIHIDAASGDRLKAWLATGTGHTGTIAASLPATSNPAVADVVANFSSRGPYTNFDILGPNVAAPGVNIFAAGSNHVGAGSVAGLYGMISGTSMASPHIAGAATLLKASRPEWTDAEVLSAMITTGVTTLTKNDDGKGAIPATAHDIGGGRIQLAAAVKAGLVLNETMEGFLAGDPAKGGDPGELNVAELVRQKCVVECGWTRTVKATAAGTWNVTGPAYVTVTPAQFTLNAGQTQDIVIKADVRTLPLGVYAFGSVVLTPSATSLPTQHIPLVVLPTGSSLPSSKEIIATRNQGSTTLTGVKSVAADAITFKVAGLGLAQKQELTVAQDSDNTAVYDDLADGISFTTLTVPDGSEQVVVEILASASPDLDLRVGTDNNGDGLPSEDEEVCVSATGTSLERCAIDLAGATGLPPFWVLVQNYQASAPTAVDAFTLATTIVGTADAGNLVVKGPTGPVSALAPWNLTLNWTAPAAVGESAYGKVRIYRSATQDDTTLIGTIQVRLQRAANDVSVTLPELVKVNEAFPVQLTVGPNYDSVNRRYQIRVQLPAGVNYVNGSGGRLQGRTVNFTVNTPAGTLTAPSTPTTVQFQVTPQRSAAGTTLTFTATDTVNNPNSVAQTATDTAKVSGYVFSGFTSPRPGSTVFSGWPTTVRFEIRDGATNTVSTTPVALQITNPDGSVLVDATVNGTARGGHAYNWATNGLKSGQYGVKVTLDDGTSYSMSVRIFSFRG